MNISRKEIQRSLRDFGNIISDLINAEFKNLQSLTKRFVSFSMSDTVISKIMKPLLVMKLDRDNIIIDYEGASSDINIPSDMTEHISFVIQLLYQFEDAKNDAFANFALQYFPSHEFDSSISKMNDILIKPAMRELINKINDFIEDEVKQQESIELSSIQIFNIGDIVNKNGNIAIGQDIKIDSVKNIDKLSDEFLKIILEKGYSYTDFELIKDDIELIKEQLNKENPNNKILEKAFQNIKNIRDQVFFSILVNLISSPIVNDIVSKLS